MKSMTVDEIRQSYLDFFESKAHKRMGSDSLVPAGDPTLLFTGAGMNQFKEYFLGLKKDMKRATSSQKCIRTGDLENVGKTAYHHSFFEMLGNFSFGDYFKEEAITWAWEYLTKVLEIPEEKLRVTVHHTDDEAYAIWRDKVKVREDWIYKMGDEDNYWPANAPKDGPNGPCGPCSEIYYDAGLQAVREGEDPESIESKRFAEIWNLVFTQFDRQEGGNLIPLKNKNIDTGMGLERLACVLQGKSGNFEIDIFDAIHQGIEKVLNVSRDVNNKNSLNAIADHLRAVVFSVADGVIPSNEGRGYVIRKLIRRAVWHAYQVTKGALKEPFLHNVVSSVVTAMSVGYPELKEASKSIEGTIKGEEERFLDTLETGMRILNQKIEELKKAKQKELPGEVVFELYDTYGFPEELTQMIAEETGFTTNEKAFDDLMEEQRARAKKASQISDRIFVTTDLEEKIHGANLNKTTFLGYDQLAGEGFVLLSEITDGKGVIVLDQTPFYGESGGQVGDQGTLESGSFKAQVVDTQKKDDIALHYVDVKSGDSLDVGSKVSAVVDKERRFQIMRNHTATHLLHAALRSILGDQVRQLGSLVAPDRLRFDFSYPKALKADQIKEIEDAVNAEILKNTQVSKVEKGIEEAKKEGAIAFFGEKYGDRVRIVDVPGYSKEFCGGTHCDGTGQIGSFIIVSESSVASGTRRIEAFTGEGAVAHMRELRKHMDDVARDLKTTPQNILERVRKLKETVKQYEKGKIQNVESVLSPKEVLKDAIDAGPYKFALCEKQNMGMDPLRKLSDQLKNETEQLIYFIASNEGEKVNFLLGMSDNLKDKEIDLRDLMKGFSSLLGIRGGGRREMIQGGAKNENQFTEKREQIIQTAVDFLQSTVGS